MQDFRETQNEPSLTGGIRRKPVPSRKLTTAPFLDKAETVECFPKGWPISPRVLKVSIYTILWSLLVDFVLLACSVAFFAFACIVKSYDGLPTQDSPHAKERLLSASKYGPTIFPILFAAVVGRAAYAIMIWRLETGERIGILDTLAGSTSLTSTITTLFKLRVISGLGIILVTVWALSPVGGQASFRQFSIVTRTDSELAFYNYTTTNGDLGLYQDSGRSMHWAVVNTLFLAAIVGPSQTKTSPRDLWGNVKIPRIEHFESNNNFIPDQDGWYNTRISQNQESNPMVFTSLIGLPMAGFKNSNFIDNKWNIQTSYFNLSNCVLTDPNYGRRPRNTSFVTNFPDDNGGLIWWNSSFNATNGHSTPRSNISFINGSMPAFRFAYSSQIGPGPPGECSIQTIYVELEVFCADAASCLVSRMRRSRLDHPHANITQLDFQTHIYWNWYLFAAAFVASTKSRSAYPTLLDNYIQGSGDPLVMIEGTEDQPYYLTVIKLGQLINTFWLTASNPYVISRGQASENTMFNSNFSYSIVQGGGGESNSGFFNGSYWQTQGMRSRRIEVFQAHIAWVIMLCIASALLIASSLVPPIVRHFLTKGVDIMMNISSLATRDNPYIKLPSSGTSLEASDRARHLRDCKVRFGDVESERDVGKLAIGEMRDESEKGIARARKGRLYK